MYQAQAHYLGPQYFSLYFLVLLDNNLLYYCIFKTILVIQSLSLSLYIGPICTTWYQSQDFENYPQTSCLCITPLRSKHPFKALSTLLMFKAVLLCINYQPSPLFGPTN